MLNPGNLLFFFILISSSLMAVSSTSWFGAWMGLEINLLSFIPILSNDMNQRSSEASLKYFLSQALGSIILISSAISSFFISNSVPFQENMFIMLISSALLLKLGAAPFHFWFPAVMEGLSWINSIILMTWQKLAPLALLSYNIFKPELLVSFSILSSAIVGSLGGLNQTLLRKIMAFSSINHIGWIMAAMLWSDLLWLIYYLLYIILASAVTLIFFTFNIFHINQVHEIFQNNSKIKLILSFNFLSLGGLPPFLGFIPKWMIIQNLLINKMYLITFTLIMTALITLYFYIRIIYLSITTISSSKLWYHPTFLIPSKINTTLLIFSLMSLLALPSVSLLIPIF
nr:NADH dehydrogenase subunit 2 [Coreamachilis songi]